MTAVGLAGPAPAAISSIAFAALTWGAVALVLAAFVYVVWALFGDRARAD
jgi:hypothetical protein